MIFQDQKLTFRQLNDRANRLAHYLRGLGIGPEKLVGLCVDRSPDMVVGMLGILKAGGAYLPLDPSYPAERLAFMLADAQVQCVLTQNYLLHGWAAQTVTLLPLDTLRKELSTGDCDNLHVEVQPAHLAYVLYTSGSTGKPKGVMLEHRNAVAFLSWGKSAFTADELAGVVALTSLCFDLSIFEVFLPLVCGGAVIVVANALEELPSSDEVSPTLINTVPSIMRELLFAGRVPPALRVINLAGEPLPPDLVDQIYTQTGAQEVFDLYGPTEATTYVTCALRTRGGPPSIGRPIANSYIHILDSWRNPVPIGVAGEIYVGGAGIARGYLNRPDLTAERFLSNPFGSALGGRLYRTGDVGRYLPNGTIEFLGRIDHQVKIRGVRVELGEVEAALRQCPGIKEAVVVVQQVAERRQLVGYVASDHLIGDAELRTFLSRTLPDSMIPAVFIHLKSLPLTANGKVNRQALPVPSGDRPSMEREYVAPRTDLERALAAIWQQVLKLDPIGIRDNFFDLGGDSLRMIRVLAQATRLDLNTTPRQFLEDPTIAGMAERVRTERPQPNACGVRRGPANAYSVLASESTAAPAGSLWHGPSD